METVKVEFQPFVEQQIKKWEERKVSPGEGPGRGISVLTISSQPGSGGQLIGQKAAEALGFDFFDREMIWAIAKNTKTAATVIESMENERLSGIEDFIASVINDRYLWPGLYLKHLMRLVSVIGRHGHAVIMGRGANFILPPQQRLAVRIIAPLEQRIDNVARLFNVSTREARKRVQTREAKRRAFIRESFHADTSDPEYYDMVLNTAHMGMEAATQTLIAALSAPR